MPTLLRQILEVAGCMGEELESYVLEIYSLNIFSGATAMNAKKDAMEAYDCKLDNVNGIDPA